MLGTESIMTLNFAGQGFGVGFGEMNEMSPQRLHVGNGNGQRGSNGPAELGAGGAGGAAGEETGFLKEDAMTSGGAHQQQQLLPPTPQAPSSWASKVRAGLGSDCSPTLSGSAGIGGSGLGATGGSGALGDLDPGMGDGIHGLSHGMGHLGPLASSMGGGSASSSSATMGPVHGLDMERGMPGKSLLSAPSASAPGPAGVVQGLVGLGNVRGHQDPLQQRVGEGLGNGDQGVGLGVGGGGGQNGSGALAQDFGALEIVGGGELGSRGTGAGEAQQGFDAAKNDLLGDFPCVRLRGLAADTSVKDILDFFVGLGPVLDIVLEGGAADGEVGAITLFGTLMDYHGALQRYSLQIKGRYIEVAPAVRSDYYSAVTKRSAGGAAGTAGEMTAAAEGGEGIRDPQGQNGPPRRSDAASATASGKAPGPAAALRTAPHGTLSPLAAAGGAEARHADTSGLTAQAAGATEAPAPGARSPAVAGLQHSPATAGTHAGGGGGAVAGAVAAGGGGSAGARKGGAKGGPLAAAGSSKAKGSAGDAKGTVIRMRGLPYRASKSEVMGFFKGCSIPEDGIAFVTRADGRVTGEAYVRFATREDAKTGIRKDREMMGSRYIELFTSSPEEMARYANSKR